MGDKDKAMPSNEINIMELLLQISSDVSSIKTEMAHYQKELSADKENTAKEIADVRSDFNRELTEFETRLSNKINSLQTVQNSLVGDVDTLKHAEDKKDAKRWRNILALIGTALAGLLLGKLPEILNLILTVNGGK